jgi:outer membrane receptor protein involved in Fe transport
MVNVTNAHGFDQILVSKGKGRNYGIDFTLERFLNKGYYYLLTASFYDSKYKGSDGVERNTVYNNNYVINILGGKEWQLSKNRILGLSGRLYFKGGNRYSPIDLAASQLKESVVYDDDTEAFTQRYPSYYRVDISATYRKNHKKYSSEWAVELNNILFSPTTYDQVFDYKQDKVVTKKYGKPFPSISYKIEF